MTRPAGRDPGPPRPGIDARLVEHGAEALLESDALTGDSDGTPSIYYVDPENIEYLVGIVLAAVADARPAPAAQPAVDEVGEARLARIIAMTPDCADGWTTASQIAKRILADGWTRDAAAEWEAPRLARATGSAHTADTARDEGDGDG